jgi:hypothetical protein
MGYPIRIEVKDDPVRNRLWDARKRLLDGNGSRKEQREALRLANKLGRMEYGDLALLCWELENGRRLPVGAWLIVFCGERCLIPEHMGIEVPRLLCKVCCAEDGLLNTDGHGEERRN